MKDIIAANFSGFFAAILWLGSSVGRAVENPCVAGSIPARATMFYCYHSRILR